ncbi:MAG TPA: recombinase family protein [Allocoleopsis sp.]
MLNFFKKLLSLKRQKYDVLSKTKRKRTLDSESESEYSVCRKKYKSDVNSKDCIIYCRISSKQQSLISQEKECVDYCIHNNFNILEIVNEIASARDIANLKNLLKIIHENSDITIVVYSVDRFCRNTSDSLILLNVLHEKNINLVAVADSIDLSTASGKHQFRTRVSVAELESDLIKERVKRTVSYKRQNGEYLGSIPPYGFRIERIDGKRIKVKDSLEQNVISFILKNYLRVVKSCDFTSQLYKLLSDFNKPADFFVSVDFYDSDGNLTEKTKVTAEMLCDILNDYQIFKRNGEWRPYHIKKIYKSNIETLRNTLKRLTI